MEAEIGIVLGARAIFSFVGLAVIFIGFWIKDRRWDELGALAYEKYKDLKEQDYPIDKQPNDPIADAYVSVTEQFVFADNGVRDLVRVESQDSADGQPRTLKTEVRAALSVPTVLLLGFGLWFISFLFTPQGGFQVYNSGWNIASMIFVAIIAASLGYGVRVATIERNVDLKKKCFITIFIFTIWLAIAGFADWNINAPWYFSTFGGRNLKRAFFLYFVFMSSETTFFLYSHVVCFLSLVIFLSASNYTLRKARKMGSTWDYNGEPNKDIVFHHGSFYLLIFGLYLLWIGLNAVELNGNGLYIPVYTGPKAWFTFIAGLGIIVPSMIALDYAFEGGSEALDFSLSGNTITEATKQVTIFGKEYNFAPAAQFLETPYVLLFGWFLLGFSAFMPYDGFKFQQLFVFLLSLVTGSIYSFLVLPTYWNANLEDHKKYAIVYCIVMILLGAVVGLRSIWSFVMSITGVAMILYGQYLDFAETKRGKHWLEGREENKTLNVFGIGNPLFVLGWIFLCHVLCLPESE